jgi:dihydrolipoamide dehydrogenase
VRLAVIGAGPGGYVAAVKASALGAQVTLIEKAEVGGTCLNRGCIPTKTMIASVAVLAKARRLAEFGMEPCGEIRPDIVKIVARKEKVVALQVKGIRALLKARGVRLVEGHAAIKGDNLVGAAYADGREEVIEADRIIIACGSRPAELPMLPFDGRKILSSSDALEFKSLPESMIIVGAGAIGSEFACMFSELGVRVTIVELKGRAVSTEDEEISELLEREFRKKKIALIKGVRIEKVGLSGPGVTVGLDNGAEIAADKILVSVGRSFNTEGLGLEDAGILKTQSGSVSVDERLETSVKGIYAIGDVIGGMMLAHVASREGVVAAKNACLDDRTIMDYSAIPAAIFTSPQIASVGLREFQAKERGINVRTGHFQFRSLAMAHSIGEIAGIIKIVADRDTDRLLGMSIIGPEAAELIQQGTVAISSGLRARDVADMVHAHPTLSEVVMEAMADVNGESIHGVGL